MQTDSSTSPERSVLRIEEAAAVRFLTDIKQLPFLHPFMATETTLAPVAAALAVDLSFLTRKVKQMTNLGLVEVTRRQPRRGRELCFYRSRAAEFFIPERAGAIHSMYARSVKLHQLELEYGILNKWVSQDDTAPDRGLRIIPSDGRLIIQAAIRPSESWDSQAISVSAASYWLYPRVRPEDLAWLKAELQRIADELAARRAGDGQDFLVHLAFTPRSSQG